MNNIKDIRDEIIRDLDDTRIVMYEIIVDDYYFLNDRILKSKNTAPPPDLKISRFPSKKVISNVDKKNFPPYEKCLEICKEYKEKAIAEGIISPDFDDTQCYFYPKRSFLEIIKNFLSKKSKYKKDSLYGG